MSQTFLLSSPVVKQERSWSEIWGGKSLSVLWPSLPPFCTVLVEMCLHLPDHKNPWQWDAHKTFRVHSDQFWTTRMWYWDEVAHLNHGYCHWDIDVDTEPKICHDAGEEQGSQSEWYWSKQMRVRNVYPGDANSDTYLGDLKPSELICCLLTFVQIQHLSEHVQEKGFLGQSDTWRVRCCRGDLTLAGWQWVLCFLCTLSSPRHQTSEVNDLYGLWFYSSVTICLNNTRISAMLIHVSSGTALGRKGMQGLWLLVVCSRGEVGVGFSTARAL